MASTPQSQGSLQQFAVSLFNGAAFGYDRISQLLSYGQYLRWQRAMIQQAIRHGVSNRSTVLDIATGTAGVARHLVRKAGCQVIGLDQSPGMLAAAQSKLASESSNIARQIDLVEGTAHSLPFPDDNFDAVTFTYLFRYVENPAQIMSEVVRVTRPGAFVGFVEFHVPPPPWKYLWYLHTRVLLPVAGRVISPSWYEVGRFLGPSIERFYDTWDTKSLCAMMQAAGLRDVDYRILSLGGGLVMWGRKSTTDE